MRLIRLFNDPAGKKVLAEQGVKKEVLDQKPYCPHRLFSSVISDPRLLETTHYRSLILNFLILAAISTADTQEDNICCAVTRFVVLVDFKLVAWNKRYTAPAGELSSKPGPVL